MTINSLEGKVEILNYFGNLQLEAGFVVCTFIFHCFFAPLGIAQIFECEVTGQDHGLNFQWSVGDR